MRAMRKKKTCGNESHEKETKHIHASATEQKRSERNRLSLL